MHLSYADYSLAFPGHGRSTIQIIYKPESNDCLLVWKKKNVNGGDGPDAISIINLDIGRSKGATQYVLKHNAFRDPMRIGSRVVGSYSNHN